MQNLFVGVRICTDPQKGESKIVMISDQKTVVAAALLADKSREENGPFAWVSLGTDNLHFSKTFLAEASRDYEMSLMEDAVRTKLSGMGFCLNEPSVATVIDDIVGTAYHDVLYHDVDDDYAIDEAVERYRERLTRAQASWEAEQKGGACEGVEGELAGF